MSKIFKLFAAFFVGIYNILDKLIVTPISKLIYKISKLGKSNSSKLETILNRPTVLIYVSLLCAIIVFWLVDRQVILLVDNEAEVITGQTIDVIYNQENYVVEGVPETVDITLIGSRSNLYLAKSIDNHKIELDLTKYTPGTYTVKLKYNQSRKNVSFKLDPSEVKVEISKKESKTFNLSYDLVNEQELDQKLTISSVSLKQNNIIVKGSRKTLDKIASVKALIDVKAAGFTSEGEFDDVDSITLVAFDSEGNKVNNVEMVPGNIKANIKVDSYSAELPVKIVTEGELKSGYAISSINSSVTKVTVYGEKSVIDGLTSIEAKIDVNDFNLIMNLKFL